MSESTTIVDESLDGLEAYSNVDEIGMDGFCLMVSELYSKTKLVRMLVDYRRDVELHWRFLLGKFLKVDKPTTSQDGTCSVAINKPSRTDHLFAFRWSWHPEGISFLIGGGTMQKDLLQILYAASDASHSTKTV